MIRGKKILGALLAFTLCFSMVIPAQADDISDAKKKQQELEQQKNTAEAGSRNFLRNWIPLYQRWRRHSQI